jgi:hypothetical protein
MRYFLSTVTLIAGLASLFSTVPKTTPQAVKPVTYAEHVKPILDSACVRCHSVGNVAPFSLARYDVARKWAPMIVQATESRKMPPWKAVPGHVPLKPDYRLSEQAIATLKAWHAAGAPKGDLGPEKPEVRPTTPWRYGKPDLILSPTKAYTLSAEGRDDYRSFALKTNFKEPKYVRLVDMVPGDPRVVHHALIFIDREGSSLLYDGQDGQPGYDNEDGSGFFPDSALGGYVPGSDVAPAPPGSAFEIPPGATIVLQIHYSRIGVEVKDRSQLGLYFASGKPAMRAAYGLLEDKSLRIAPGDKNYRLESEFEFDEAITLHGMMPHMHLLGKSMQVDIRNPGATRKTLLEVQDWDFGWQLVYRFAQPIALKKGGSLFVTAHFDNSAENPKNPRNPPRTVRSGARTTDEMMLLAYLFTVPIK